MITRLYRALKEIEKTLTVATEEERMDIGTATLLGHYLRDAQQAASDLASAVSEMQQERWG